MWDIVFMFIKAFIVGGLICTIGQVLINKTKLTSGKILVIFLISGVALQALGLYQYLVDFAGAGATVPISGFGYLLAKGGIEGAKHGVVGVLTGGLKAASCGIASAVVFSYIFALIFSPRSKRN